MTEARTLHVSLDGARDYDICIAPGILAQSGKMIAERLGKKRLFVVCDPNTLAHRPALEQSLIAAGHSVSFHDLPEGEGAKTWAELEHTLHWLLDQRVDRQSAVLAFGGGVAGDHAGFAAAIALRGLDVVQMPTTLLSQVDSSVGGKTGINAPQGKNMIGAFHQPRLVLIDPEILRSLPDRQLRAGYAEIVKHAFIRDAVFFGWLAQNAPAVLAHDSAAQINAIAASCGIKASIVGVDERESGDRALLNFGHTFAHALETACAYDRRLLHGEAVSIGMALAFTTSVKLGLCPATDAHRAIAHLKSLGMPTAIAEIEGFPPVSADDLLGLMAHDKKATGGKLTFILIRGIGQAFVSPETDIHIVRDVIAASL